MAQPTPPIRSSARNVVSSRPLREIVVTALHNWNRNQAFRIVAAITVAWVVGSVGIHLAEQGNNVAFDTWGESFFSVWVMLFSGLESPPKTLVGRFFAMVLLGTGVGLAGLFTGTVASVLVENQLRRRDVSDFQMD